MKLCHFKYMVAYLNGITDVVESASPSANMCNMDVTRSLSSTVSSHTLCDWSAGASAFVITSPILLRSLTIHEASLSRSALLILFFDICYGEAMYIPVHVHVVCE